MSDEQEWEPPAELTPEFILGREERFLLYGDGGTGKTHMALSVPDPIYAVGIGAKNEFKVRYSKPFLEKVGERKVFIHAIKETYGPLGEILDNPTGLDSLKRTVDHTLNWDQREGIGIKSLIFDNATVLEYFMMNKAIAAEFAITGGGDKSVLVREREWGIRKPHDNTYGAAQSLMDQFVNWLKPMPYHIVFVAHERKEFTRPKKEDGGGRIPELIGNLPLFVGQQRISIPNQFDNVWRTTVSGGGRNRQFEVQTVGDDKVMAKTRVGGILEPQNERNVNLSEVIQAFHDHAENLKTRKG